MTACKLTPGIHRGRFAPRSGGVADVLDLPVVARVRRRCRCHRPYRIDVLWSEGRLCRYLPTDQIDAVEVAA